MLYVSNGFETGSTVLEVLKKLPNGDEKKPLTYIALFSNARTSRVFRVPRQTGVFVKTLWGTSRYRLCRVGTRDHTKRGSGMRGSVGRGGTIWPLSSPRSCSLPV